MGSAPVGSASGGIARAVPEGYGDAPGGIARVVPEGYGDPAPPALRVAVVGISAGPTCGARDHALLLAEGLSGEQVSCSLHWLQRREESVRAGGRRSARGGKRSPASWQVSARMRSCCTTRSLLTPIVGCRCSSPRRLRLLRRSGIPVVTVLHEFVYPWRHGGLRGKVWAITQRALLIDVMRSSTAVLLTTDFRARWLELRPWIPRRPTAVAPVFSNLPAAAAGSSPASSDPPTALPGSRPIPSHPPPAFAEPLGQRTQPVLGLFGYSYQGAALSLGVGRDRAAH